MKNFVSVLVAIVITMNGFAPGQITEINVADYLTPDCETVAQYIVENLELFAQSYNRQLDDGSPEFQAKSCEFTVPVLVTNTNERGIYLDFDGDHGYMVITDDYNVVAFKTTGDLPYLRELDYAYYSLYDGFVYPGENGYIPYESKALTPEELAEYQNLKLGYDGQLGGGTDGSINDPDAFVRDKYGNGYEVYEEKILWNFVWIVQNDLSIYYKNGSGESNCGLSSIYATLLYARGRYPSLPGATDRTTYFASTDKFFEKYKNDSAYRIDTPKSLPNLYLDARAVAIEKYGYEVSGVSAFEIPEIIKAVRNKYNLSNMTVEHWVLWTYDVHVVSEIDSGFPTIFNMANSSTYGSHTAVVIGYKNYRRAINVLGLKLYEYVKIGALNDNWVRSVRYFDFTEYKGVGSFVQVR